MRFSLRDLLLFVAFAAGVAWCAGQVGFDNPWFWSAIGVGAVMSALFVTFARSEKPRRRGWLATIPVVLFSFFFLSSAIFIDAALLTICGAILYYRERPSIRTLCDVCMASGLVALAAGVVPGALAVRQLNAERRRLPVVSLVDGLQYERRHHSGHAPSIAVMSTSVANELSGWERWLDDGAERKHDFELLHNLEYVQFVQAIGFGVGRVRPMRPSSLRRPPLRNIDFKKASTVESFREQGYWRASFWPERSNAIERLHITSRNDFLDPDGFGVAIEPPLTVTGFVEHAFHYPPYNGMGDATPWAILRLELVSLLKFDEPRVYVLDHLPRMDQLSSDNAPTRPLDSFESDALAKLWHDEDVVVKNEGENYRMLGSLRAAKQCLDCHSVPRGELLGAFSYSLRHEPASKSRGP